MTKERMLSGWIFLFICLTALPIASCRKEEKEVNIETLIPVRTQEVRQEEVSKPLVLSGRIASKKELKLSFKMGGIIQRIFVDEGQEVKKGQNLARLDLSEIEAQVKQARSALAKTQRDLDRMKNLYAEKAVTLEQFQNVQTAYDLSRSRLDAAEFNLRFSEITAPTRGRILRRLVEEHELVGAGMPVFFFASDAGGWIIRTGVSEVDVVRLSLDDPASLSFDAYPNETLEAEISEIVESPDPRTGTYEVELSIRPTQKKLISGFTARVEIRPQSTSLRTIIPVEALVQADGSQGVVFSIDSNNRARRVPVLIDFILDDKIALREGLEDISRVVTEGGDYLRDGDRVKIITGRSGGRNQP